MGPPHWSPEPLQKTTGKRRSELHEFMIKFLPIGTLLVQIRLKRRLGPREWLPDTRQKSTRKDLFPTSQRERKRERERQRGREEKSTETERKNERGRGREERGTRESVRRKSE